MCVRGGWLHTASRRLTAHGEQVPREDAIRALENYNYNAVEAVLALS